MTDLAGDYHVLRTHLHPREDLAGTPFATLGTLLANVTAQSLGPNPTDTAGFISLTMGAAPPGAGAAVCIVNFGRNFPAAPLVFVCQQGGAAVAWGVGNVSTSGWQLVSPGGLTANATYTFAYWVVGK